MAGDPPASWIVSEVENPDGTFTVRYAYQGGRVVNVRIPAGRRHLTPDELLASFAIEPPPPPYRPGLQD